MSTLRPKQRRPTRLLIERRLAEAKARDDALMAENEGKFRLRNLISQMEMIHFDCLSPQAQQHAREHGR